MQDHWPDPHTNQELAYLQQTVFLLEARLEEQQTESRRRQEVIKHQGAVIDAARQAVAWWVETVGKYPRLTAPWVGVMLHALLELDGDHETAAAVAKRIGIEEG